MDHFSRLSLLIGEEKLHSLEDKVVAVFGLGGVGGHACEALARSGIIHFVLVDKDQVSESNINRQLIATEKTIGLNKVDVMEERLKSINSKIEAKKYCSFFSKDNADEFDFAHYDYVVDAIDVVTSKIELILKCKEHNTNIISALGCGNKMDPTKVEVTDLSKTSYDPLAKVMRRELKKYNITHLKVVYSKEEPIVPLEALKEHSKNVPGSTAFVPPVAGITMASEVIKDLLSLN